MFGFIGKFKAEVLSGFEAIHARIVTLEAKVEALFNHTKVVAAETAAQTKETVVAAVDAGETKVAEVEVAIKDAAATVEAVKTAS